MIVLIQRPVVAIHRPQLAEANHRTRPPCARAGCWFHDLREEHCRLPLRRLSRVALSVNHVTELSLYGRGDLLTRSRKNRRQNITKGHEGGRFHPESKSPDADDFDAIAHDYYDHEIEPEADLTMLIRWNSQAVGD